MAWSRPQQIPQLPEFVVAERAALRACLDHLATQTQIALDTEFIGEHTYRPDLCLVQLATSERLFLVDPLAFDSLTDLWELLADPGRMLVVHSGREELRACLFTLGRPPAHVFDVQIAAGLIGRPYPASYASLTHDLLGCHTNKSETLTDWRKRPLTPAQRRYALDDVRYLLPLWRKLHDRLRRLNREDWAGEEFAAFVKRATADDPPEEKWRRLKGIGRLSRRDLAVARELYIWRDSVAAKQNRPPRAVLRDEVLVELARQAPATEQEAAAWRGLAKGLIPGVLGAIRKAKGLAANDYPAPVERDGDAPQVHLLASLLGIVLAQWCERNHLAANLAATQADLRAVVRTRQRGQNGRVDSPLFSGWRQRVLLPELEAFLDGSRSLTVRDAAAADPIAVLPIRAEPPRPRND